MGSETNTMLHLTQSQAINIACYKHHKLNHSISFDRATLIDIEGGCRLRVLGYKYVDFPLHDGVTRGAISSCFHLEYSLDEDGNIDVFFDTEDFSIFGKNFRILNENGSGYIDGSDLDQIMMDNSGYKGKYYPTLSDKTHFIAELKSETQLKRPTMRLIREWLEQNK